jgi:hypothetical protein
MRKSAVCFALLLVAIVPACGDDASTSSSVAPTTSAGTTTVAPSTPTTPVATTTTLPAGLDVDGMIADGTVVREFLFDTIALWGEAALDLDALAAGIQTVYPIDVRGSARDADPEGISIFANPVDDKDVVGTDNPWVVAFAVADTTGACIGGIVFGFPAPDTTLEAVIPEGAPCQAGVVHDMSGLLIDLLTP